MARDILREYGSDSPANQRARATSGGDMPVRDVRNYQPPQGPLHIMNTGVGLRGGTNHGNGQRPTASKGECGGSAGLHGTNRGNKGQQR